MKHAPESRGDSRSTAPAKKPFLIHIPKTGGTAIKRYLGLETKIVHGTYSEHIEQFGSGVFADRTTIAVVRNPWDIAVSWWEFHRKPAQMFVSKANIAFYAHYRSFEEWVCAGMPTHWATQVSMIPKRPTHPLDQLSYITHDGRVAVDAVLRFESLDADVRRFHPMRAPFERVNVTTKALASYRLYYTSDALVSAVAVRNRELNELFAYSW